MEYSWYTYQWAKKKSRFSKLSKSLHDFVCVLSQCMWHTPLSDVTYLLRCCNMLQCVAVCERWVCDTLQHTATHCSTLQHTATHCYTFNILQHIATHCNTLQHIATHCNTLQHIATHCNTLQNIATSEQMRDINVLQCVAVCEMLQCAAMCCSVCVRDTHHWVMSRIRSVGVYVCMCVCVYVCMCVCVYVCMCVYVTPTTEWCHAFAQTNKPTISLHYFACMCVCVYVCMYVCMCVCVYACMCLCVYVCRCVCV